LFLPRVGILNENHLPNSFNGNERTQVETYILPSTWRELGIGYYGNASRLPISYSIALINGLNSASFEHGSVIREGRYEGRNASANNLALTGSVQLHMGNFKSQISGYYGGSAGIPRQQADTLGLASGIFSTPIIIGEFDLQYENAGFSTRILGSLISIPNSLEINKAYANNTPESAYGAYAEVAYDLFKSLIPFPKQQLVVFARYEILDMNAKIPANGITDGTLKQSHMIAGLNYLPIKNIAVKMDIRLRHTGDQNPNLVTNPDPSAVPYKVNDAFLNIGIGFSF
jgi:hypothetical protein